MLVALVLGIEGLIAAHDLDLTSIFAWNYRFAARAARREAPRCGVLCFGDSQVKFGVDPKVIEERLGTPAYNLAILGAQAPATYFLLKRSLDAGARPRAVVVNYKPSAIAGDPRVNAQHLPELVGPGEGWDLARSTRDPGHFLALMAARVLPSLRVRGEVRAAILAALEGRSGSVLEASLNTLRDWRRDRGAHLLPAEPVFDGHLGPGEAGTYFPERWIVPSVQARYIRRFLDLAASRQIAVYWLIPPIVPEAQARREALGLEDRHERFVRAMQEKCPSLVVLDARRSGFPPSHFADPCHLNRQGAQALSERVAEALGRGVGEGSGWVELVRCPGSIAGRDEAVR